MSFKVSWLFACFYPENSSFSSNFWTLCLLFSLVFSILFYIYLLLKSRFHFFFGSNLKKIWECNYLEVLCRIKSFRNWLCLFKSFVKEFKNYFRMKKIRKVIACFDKRNNCFSGHLFLWNSFRECFGFKTALPVTRSNRMITDWET